MPNVSHQDGGGGGVGGGGVGRLGFLGGTVYCVIPAGDCFSTLMSSHVERLVSSRPAKFRSGPSSQLQAQLITLSSSL